MMNDLAANKSHVPCQSWAAQNDWSTASAQGALPNSLSSSQHLGLGPPCVPTPSYDHPSCLSTLSSITSAHPTALYRASHVGSNLPSTSLFASAALPSASHIVSFAQQSPHASSMPPAAIEDKNVTAEPHQPLLPCPDPYKSPFQPPAPNQGLQDMLINLLSCGQPANPGPHGTSQYSFEGVSVESADAAAGYVVGHPSSSPHEQPQWIPSPHCSEARNEPVPDAAAALPKEEPPQEWKALPADIRETRRSEVLHQRAQLLKQLAELDKMLELLPPDDIRSDQSSNTALQFPSSMDDSSQCEQTKTSDPQPAVKVKEEENSSEATDYSDADHFLSSDEDFPDISSVIVGVSSDESSHNSLSTPQKEAPPEEPSPLPGKKRTNLGEPLSKDRIVSPLKRACPANQKPLTVVLPCSNSKAQRVYDRRNYCLFCLKPMSKMARHLESIHIDKPEVAAVFQYPKNSKERQKIWTRLINQGNFIHNKDVLRTGRGQLAVRKRSKKAGQAQDFLHCLYCRGLYVKKALGRHMRVCPEKERSDGASEVGRKRVASRCVLETLGDDLEVSEGFRGILSQMIYDNVTQAIMSDKTVLQFGEQMFDQHGSNAKRHDYIRQNLRQLARLVLEAQRITPLKTLEDFFLPSNFPHVVAAVNVLAGYDPESKTYGIPSLAIKLGYHLQKACDIVGANAAKSGDAGLAEAARSFLSMYHKQWNGLISSGALTTLKGIKESAEKKVPFAQDVKRLNFYMESVHRLAERKLGDCPSAENYAALARVALARTIIFNRRRAGEVSAMQLKAFMSRKTSDPHGNLDIYVSEFEKNMCRFFTRVEIRGTCGRMVPVFLKPSVLSAMELLVKLREGCGVPDKNPFLFGRPNALSAYNGADCIQKYVKECGAKDPEALTSTKIRKHYATMLQLMNLDEDEVGQTPGADGQSPTLQQDKPSEVQMDSAPGSRHARAPRAAPWDQTEPPGASVAAARTFAPPESEDCGKKGSRNKSKQKWEEAEVRAVERHMMPFIQRQRVPQKRDCLQCLEAEPRALGTRSWKGVKDYVRNRITALKRQGGSPQARQVDPQTTGHFQQL